MTEPEISFCHKTASQLTALKTFSHGVKQNMLFGILLTKMVVLFSLAIRLNVYNNNKWNAFGIY